MTNKIRNYYKEEVERLLPLLHDTYRLIGAYQKSRAPRLETKLFELLDQAGGALQFCKPHMQAAKRAYFDAALDQNLAISDRIIAFDTAVGMMHIEFPARRAYSHRESEELRKALASCRIADTEERSQADETADDVICAGIPASPGVASGKAMIVRSAGDYRRLPAGSIVVAQMTRTDFIVAVDRIAGIVTDIGGRLCHAAIVARELGIPCVVGTGNATQTIRSRQLVQVDGGRGVVTCVR